MVLACDSTVRRRQLRLAVVLPIHCQLHNIWPLISAKLTQFTPVLVKNGVKKRPNNKKYAVPPLAVMLHSSLGLTVRLTCPEATLSLASTGVSAMPTTDVASPEADTITRAPTTLPAAPPAAVAVRLKTLAPASSAEAETVPPARLECRVKTLSPSVWS